MAATTIIFGNLTASISDHQPQFLATPNIYLNSLYPKSNKYDKYETGWSKSNQENFVLDYISVDWDNAMRRINMKIDKLCKIFPKMSLLDGYAPLKNF